MNKPTKKLCKAVKTLYNIAKQNNFDYFCNDILEYNKTLDYTLMNQANQILLAILKGNRNITEFQEV
jgi:hypothetical protein